MVRKLDDHGGILAPLDRYRMLLFWDKTVQAFYCWGIILTSFWGLFPVLNHLIFSLSNPAAHEVMQNGQRMLWVGAANGAGTGFGVGVASGLNMLALLLWAFFLLLAAGDFAHSRRVKKNPITLESSVDVMVREVRWYTSRNQNAIFLMLMLIMLMSSK